MGAAPGLGSTEECEAVPKFHRASIFGSGPRVPLDREQRAQFRAKLKMQTRRGGRITGAAADIGMAMVNMLGADGQLDPTVTTISARAGVGRTQTYEGLNRLEQCGFLARTRRLKRNSGTGWRAEQTSSAYVLLVPGCESGFRTQVFKRFVKKAAPEGSGGWEEQCANAARQLDALGYSVPPTWGSKMTV